MNFPANCLLFIPYKKINLVPMGRRLPKTQIKTYTVGASTVQVQWAYIVLKIPGQFIFLTAFVTLCLEHLDECRLYCMASGHKFYARLKNHVNIGTPCGKDYSKVCIKGKCQVLEFSTYTIRVQMLNFAFSFSKFINIWLMLCVRDLFELQKRPSGCQSLDGPCLVDERKKILGVFNSTRLNIGKPELELPKETLFLILIFRPQIHFTIGYNLVATIPAGATNITIEELSRSRSYLGKLRLQIFLYWRQLIRLPCQDH